MQNYREEVDTALQRLGHGPPRSVYDDGWPGHHVPEIEISGHLFAITPTTLIGGDSGRTRFRVECKTCGEMLHEATTGPRLRIASHLELGQRSSRRHGGITARSIEAREGDIAFNGVGLFRVTGKNGASLECEPTSYKRGDYKRQFFVILNNAQLVPVPIGVIVAFVIDDNATPARETRQRHEAMQAMREDRTVCPGVNGEYAYWDRVTWRRQGNLGREINAGVQFAMAKHIFDEVVAVDTLISGPYGISAENADLDDIVVTVTRDFDGDYTVSVTIRIFDTWTGTGASIEEAWDDMAREVIEGWDVYHEHTV